MLSLRDPPQIKRYTQGKSKGMEKDISCKWKGKKKLGQQYLYRQNRPENQGFSKRQRRTIHNDKGNNSTGHITLINIYAPNSVAPIYVKQILMDLKGEIKRNTVIRGDLNTH